jgi:uncharacterized delta-60 repeat protein
MPVKNYSPRPARPLLAFAFALAALLCSPGHSALAAAGDLDLSFDADGKVTTDFFGGVDNGRAVAVQPDGKIVVAGTATNGAGTVFAVARYNADGSPDASFDADGKVTTEFAGANSVARGLALQPDGKIVVAGTAGGDFALVRYNSDGSLDVNFGTGGRVTTDFFVNSDICNAVALQPDGKIVAAGAARNAGGFWHFALARYAANGTPDASFDGDGRVATSFDAGSAIGEGPPVTANAVALQADGKIVAAGKYVHDFAVVRYTAGGALDPEFNTGGKQVFPFVNGFGGGEVSSDRTDRATAVVIQSDGRIVVGGSVQRTNNVFTGGLARLTQDGRLDPTFSGNGLLLTGPDSFISEEVIGLALQKNGKILVAGRDNAFHSVRVNLDGTLDQTYSGDGRQTTDFDAGQLDAAEAVAVQPDGRIVVAGTALDRDFGLVRYLGDAPDVQCLYGLSRARHVAPRTGGAGQVYVFAPPGCAWTAASNAPWIAVVGDAAGAGDRAVNFTVEPSGPGLRTGTLTIAGQTFTVAQNGFKVAVYYGGGQSLGDAVRAAIAGTGLFAQVDAFTLHAATTPTLPHLLQYDAVFHFHNNVSGPPNSNQPLVGNVLADYVERGRGVVLAGSNWDGDHVRGRILLEGYLPFLPGNGSAAAGALIKLQSAHPVLQGVSDVNSGGHATVTVTTNSQRLANWSDGRAAVATKQPFGGRVVGLNFFPTSAPSDNRTRLMANSLHWAASGPATHSVFMFGAASFTSSEGARGASVSVARFGPDLSEPATVEFLTVDDAAGARCDAATGLALARCDYATTVLTLAFAPGESSKTVNVPLVDDGHAEGTETASLRLGRAFGARLGEQSGASLIITDNDAPGAPNPLDTHAFFVRQHYLDFLSREPEEPGQTAWVNVLGNCPDANNDPRCDRATVSSSFFRAQEFHLKGNYAFRFYRAAFGRLPDYSEIAADMSALTGATPEEVFRRRADFAEAFTERGEFLASFPPAGSHAAYVNALLNPYLLESIRTRDPANPETGPEVTLTKTELTNRLNAGTLTRGQVLRALVESREVDAREYNGAFVAMQYYGYLRRAPEHPGYQNWLNYLNAHPDDFRTMIKGFIDSVEYRLRFGRQ